MLKTNTTLESLDFCTNHITVKGASLICDAIGGSQALDPGRGGKIKRIVLADEYDKHVAKVKELVSQRFPGLEG